MKFIILFFFIKNICAFVLKPNNTDFVSITAEEFLASSPVNELGGDLQDRFFSVQEEEELSWYLHRPSEIAFLQRHFDFPLPDFFARRVDSAVLRPFMLSWLQAFLAENPEIIPENLRKRAEGRDLSEYIDFEWTMSPTFFHPRKRLSFMITVTAFNKPFLVFARAVYFTGSGVYVLEIHCPFKERLQRVFEEICAHFRTEDSGPAEAHKNSLQRNFRSEDFLRLFLLPPTKGMEFKELMKENRPSLLEHSGKLGLFVVFSSVLFFLFLPGRK